MPGKIKLSQGDITQFSADAMGNAANSFLQGGGGVDGAIHKAAGPELLKELKERFTSGCGTGGAVITNSYGSLKVKKVIHAVGPIWSGGFGPEEELLAFAYKNSFRLAEENSCKHLLMPSISTGVYGFPIDLAAPIAISESQSFLENCQKLNLIEFVLFNSQTLLSFKQALKKLNY